MGLAIRLSDGDAPGLAPLAGLEVRRELDAGMLATVQGRTAEEMERRIREGHRAYVATIDGCIVAWGWVATRSAWVGEVNAAFRVHERERYLWNFVTAPTHRGLGIYPRLLDQIVRSESGEADRFWIAYAPENHASAAGIRRAGFVHVGELSFDASGRPAVRGSAEMAAEGARRLDLSHVDHELAPCWRCARTKPLRSSCRAATMPLRLPGAGPVMRSLTAAAGVSLVPDRSAAGDPHRSSWS